MNQRKKTITKPSIKDLLKKDFNLDVDISGGFGQSREDPILVLSKTESEALRNELLVVRSLISGANLEGQRTLLWRSIGINLIEGPSPNIIQHKIETKEILKDEIITEKRNFYFSRKNLEISPSHILQGQVIAYEDQKINMHFPDGLGWLHYKSMKDFGPEKPELGYSLAYSAAGIKATIYVYPFRDQQKSLSSILKTEMENSRRDIVHYYGEEAIEGDWDVQQLDDNLMYCFMYNEETSFKVVGCYPSLSWLTISGKNDYYIKMRSSHFDEPLMREIGHDLVNSLFSLIRS